MWLMSAILYVMGSPLTGYTTIDWAAALNADATATLIMRDLRVII